MAEEVLRQRGSTTRIGYRWPDRLLNRYKRVKTKDSVLLERLGVRGSTRAKYKDFFNRLGE